MSNNTKNTSKKGGFKSFLTARNTRRGATSIGVTVLIIAAVILVNVILAILSSRNAMYLDVTANRSFKLQSTTVGYLEQLDKDVDIYVLANEEDLENNNGSNYQYYVQANRLLHEYEYNSDHITLHYVDLVRNPTFLSQYPDVNRSETHMLLVVCGKNYTAVDGNDLFSYDTETYQEQGYTVVTSQHVEQAVTSAILKVTDSDRITVSVLEGQDEADVSAYTSRLAMNAYEIETVNLSTGNISASSEFLIINKPLSDIDKDVYKKISDWLLNNGEYGHNVIYFPNDELPVDLFPNINALLTDYGMKVDYAFIFEMDSDHLIPGNSLNNSLFDYADTEFTADLVSQSKKVIMGGDQGSLAVEVIDRSVANEMLVSSDNVSLYDVKTQELKEVDGTLCGAAIGRKGGSSSTNANSGVVTIGSCYAVSNLYLTADTYNNADYFINMVNVLSHKENIGVIIDGKDPRSTELGVSSRKDISFLGVFVRFIIPGLVLAAGLIVWIRRRHK